MAYPSHELDLAVGEGNFEVDLAEQKVVVHSAADYDTVRSIISKTGKEVSKKIPVFLYSFMVSFAKEKESRWLIKLKQVVSGETVAWSLLR